MAERIYIDPSSPLSRMYLFDDPLPGPVAAHSVQQMWGYVLAMRSGLENREEIAGFLLTVSPDQVGRQLEVHGIGMTAPEIFASADIYIAILMDQVQRENSPIRQEMEYLVSHYPHNPAPMFMVTGSGEDRIWSCGLNRSKFERRRNPIPAYRVPGANVYGMRVLSSAFRGLRRNEFTSVFDFNELVSPESPIDLGLGDARQHTILVLSDSMSKWIKHVHGGSALPISGGVFADIVDAIGQTDDLSEFHALIVHCGVNIAKRSDLVRAVEIKRFAETLMVVRAENPQLTILVSLAILHEGKKTHEQEEFAATGHSRTYDAIRHCNREIKHAIREIEGVNLCEFHGGGPFWQNPRCRDVTMYDHDDFHLSRFGTQTLWRHWMMELSSKFLLVQMALGKRMYQDDYRPRDSAVDGSQNEPGVNQVEEADNPIQVVEAVGPNDAPEPMNETVNHPGTHTVVVGQNDDENDDQNGPEMALEPVSDEEIADSDETAQNDAQIVMNSAEANMEDDDDWENYVGPELIEENVIPAQNEVQVFYENDDDDVLDYDEYVSSDEEPEVEVYYGDEPEGADGADHLVEEDEYEVMDEA